MKASAAAIAGVVGLCGSSACNPPDHVPFTTTAPSPAASTTTIHARETKPVADASRTAPHPREPGADASATSARSPADGSSCEPGALPPGDEAWRRSLAEDDVTKVTAVASDPSTGAVFVSRAAGESFKIDRGGAPAWERPFGSFVATDGVGNAYVAGTFSGTVDLGASTLASAGGTDVYVAALDADGNVSFGVSLGGVGDETVLSIAVGADRSAVVSGPGLGTVKLDPEGHTLWQREFFGHAAVDSTGSVLLTGALEGETRFGATTLVSKGGQDVFVAKLDPDGNTLFAHRFGDEGLTQRGEAITVDLRDDILVSGVSDGRIDFGGDTFEVHPGTCPEESWCRTAGFVVAFDASGRHLWSHAHAPVRSLPGIAADVRGNVLVSGAYPGNAPPYRLPLLFQFDERGNEITALSHRAAELFDAGAGHGIAFDSCGDVLWALSIPPSPGEPEHSVVVKLSP